MLTFGGLVVGILILVLPGAALLILWYKPSYAFSPLDKTLSVLVVSGVFNYLFFLPRLIPSLRLGAYLFILFFLVIFSVRKVFFQISGKNWKEKFKFHRLWKSHRRFLGFVLGGFVIAFIFVGYPYHQLNVSRSQLSPMGGDVLFFLYKTHLLRAGYSFLDDIYFGEIPSYPDFPMSQVALMTLLTGGNLALNAEVYRLLLAITIFGLWYALGRALTFRPGESLILAVFSLSGYYIWQHLTTYVSASMSFFATFLFLYFMLRAWLTRNRYLWLMAGLAASLVVHSHMVHAAFGAFFTIFMVGSYILFPLKERFSFIALWNQLKWFFVSGIAGSALFLVPLWWRYGFKSTDKFHSPEGEAASWDLNLGQWFEQELSAAQFWWATALILFIWLLAALFFFLKRKKLNFFLPAAHFWGLILLIIYILEFISLKIRNFAIYIDVRDFFNITYPFRLIFFAVAGLRLLEYFFSRSRRKIMVTQLVSMGIILMTLFFMIPANYSGYVPTFLNNYAYIWNWTSLKKSLEKRSAEGNTSKERDFFAADIHKYMPLYSSVLFTDPDVMLSLSGNFERQTMIYGPPWSNMFLPIPVHQRLKEVRSFYQKPTSKKLINIIKKYKVTHILWTWQNDRALLEKLLMKSPFLTFKVEPNFVGVLFEVNPVKFRLYKDL